MVHVFLLSKHLRPRTFSYHCFFLLQDADSVLFLYRDEYYNPTTQDKNIAECIIAKNRHGETGTVKLQWRPQFFTFSDLEWKHEG